jgi:hypothetical protein
MHVSFCFVGLKCLVFSLSLSLTLSLSLSLSLSLCINALVPVSTEVPQFSDVGDAETVIQVMLKYGQNPHIQEQGCGKLKVLARDVGT